MKNKKIITIVIVISIILIIVAGLIYKNKIGSIDYIIQRQNNAEKNRNVDIIWQDMHPDDKSRWTEQEYKIVFLNSVEIFSNIQKKDIKLLSQWVHPITAKMYNDVVEVTNTYISENTKLSYDTVSYFVKSDNRWYFFSTFLSSNDRGNIKSKAVQGPDYKELIKNPNKYIGEKVIYTGKVIEIQEDRKGNGIIRLDVGKDIFSDEIIFITYNQSTDVFEGDTVTVYGILSGSYTYVSQANYNITIPSLGAGIVEKGGMTKVSDEQNKPTNSPVSKTKAVEQLKPNQRIDGLTSIRISGGVWDNWDADIEKDGPIIEIVYLNKNGEIISNKATEEMPITADVKLLAGNNAMSRKEKEVFSANYKTGEIILGNIYPKIRIPKEQISVNPKIDYEFGVPVVTIHTPEQGDFSAEGYMVTLYEIEN